MEIIELKEPLQLIGNQATEFPAGIMQAFNQLTQAFPDFKERGIYGISYMEPDGSLTYKAAFSQLSVGEAERHGFESITIREGLYVAETIENWRGKEMQIAPAFRKLADSRPDTQTPGVEWYRGNDVVCMLRIEAATA